MTHLLAAHLHDPHPVEFGVLFYIAIQITVLLFRTKR